MHWEFRCDALYAACQSTSGQIPLPTDGSVVLLKSVNSEGLSDHEILTLNIRFI